MDDQGSRGLVLGILFLTYRRHLQPPMIAHATVGSLAATAPLMDWDI